MRRGSSFVTFPLDALPENLFAPSADLFTAVQQKFGKNNVQ